MISELIPEPYRSQLVAVKRHNEIEAIRESAKKAHPSLFYTEEEEVVRSRLTYTQPDRTILRK